MVFQKMINGIPVDAEYSDESVEDIFIPLLKRLTRMQEEKKKRLFVMLAAPPAAGKSTLLAFLQELSLHTPGVKPVTMIGMDGFHRYQEYLMTHDMMRDGAVVRMVELKGAPETFDLEKLTSAVRKVADGECIGWPDYNRLLHNPVEDATYVDGDIVLLEGNYLLLNWEGWRDLKSYADYTIKIKAREEDLKKRLLDRKIASGTAYEQALFFVENSDLYNARTCLADSENADLVLVMDSKGEYHMED